MGNEIIGRGETGGLGYYLYVSVLIFKMSSHGKFQIYTKIE
jgi:hypothetical protein